MIDRDLLYKKVDMRSSNFYFLKLLVSEKKSITTILLISVLFNLFLFMVPILTQVIINQISIQIYQRPTFILFGILVLLIFLILKLRLTQVKLVEKLQRRIYLNAIKRYLFFFSNWIPLNNERFKSQEVFHHFFEVFSLKKSFAKTIVDTFQFFLQVFLGLLIISFYHPAFLIYSLLLSISLYFTMLFFNEKATTLAEKSSNEKYHVISWLEQMSVNRDIFFGKRRSIFSLMKLEEKLNTLMQRQSDFFSYYYLQIKVFLMIQAAGSISLLLVGGYLVFKEQLSLGQLIAAELIITAILIGFSKLPQILDDYYDALISAKKLYKAKDVELSIKEGKELLNAPFHNWEVKNLRLSDYLADKFPFYESINFKILAESKVAILAIEAGGKSTLVSMLMKYQIPSKGVISINDKNIYEYDNKEFHDQVAVVASDSYFFKGTIEENLKFDTSNSHLFEPEFKNIFYQLGLSQIIDNFPLKMQTEMKMSGHPFSEIQKKLFALSRAIYFKPKTIIIDGLFESIDEHIANNIIQLIHSLPMTIIVTTSSESIAKKFSTIIDWRQSGLHHDHR